MADNITYVINKVLNNNVILASKYESKQEEVLVGKGLGFAKKQGQRIGIDPAIIEKSFIAYDEKNKKDYFQLVNDLDGNVIGLCEEIILMAENKLGNLNSHIHIALTDHIGFAIERLEADLKVNNPFLEEIKVLYNEEYKVAFQVVHIINKRLKVQLPESEIGFITMHFHAARQNKVVKDTVRYTSLLKDLIEMVEIGLNIKLEPGELSYIRLLNHFRFSIDRITNDKKVTNPLLPKIKEEFVSSYRLASKIGTEIENRLGVYPGEAEKGYIALHLQRLKNNI